MLFSKSSDDEDVADLHESLYVDDGVVLPGLLGVDDLVVLLEFLYLDVLDLMIYDDVAVAQFETLNFLDELAGV